ncbi:hypothetical protein [Lutibacter sp.]|uniref:hypothetical protein n=1 Tax=Lutibacter sp. TaxID=1925666 RepID=UPI00273766D7|nr:hypothetical protein [Lutibacter sp.]MDP3314390.1 hypothetical protein [Lutibacter sp.]
MRKPISLLLILFTTIVFTQNITLNELISFKTKSIKDTQLILKGKDYSYFKTINGGAQWKANDGSGIIGFNGKGLVLFMTFKSSLQKNIINEIKKSSYKYMGKSTKNNLQVDSYMKGDSTIFISEIINPSNGKILYSMTIT